MRKIIPITTIPAGIILAILVLLNSGNIDQFLGTTNTSNYLLIALIAVDGLGNFFTYYMGKKDRLAEKREKHSQEILIQPYEKLSRIVIRENDEKLIKMLLPEQTHDEDNVHLDTLFNDLRDLDLRLKEVNNDTIPYFKWALSHLENKKYKPIYQYWKNIETEQHRFETSYRNLENKLREKIQAKLQESFPQFKEFDGENSPRYISDSISKTIYHTFRHTTNNKKPNFHLQINKFDSDSVFRLMSDGSTLLQSPNKDDLKIDLLQETLVSIYYDEEIVKQIIDIMKIKGNAIETLSKFTNEMKSLVVNIKGGYVMKGKCELGY